MERELCPMTKAQIGLSFLKEELLGLERGQAPDLDLVLCALEVISEALDNTDEFVALRICRHLRAYITDLLEDGLEFALDDLDVMLTSTTCLERILAGEEYLSILEMEVQEEPKRECQAGDLYVDPEFRSSGLCLEAREDTVHVRMPRLDSARITDRVVEDLRELWLRLPSRQRWILDLSAGERVPVCVLSTLVQLERELPRECELQGVCPDLQSDVLRGRLEHRLDLN